MSSEKKLNSSQLDLPMLKDDLNIMPSNFDFLMDSWVPIAMLECTRLKEFDGNTGFFNHKLNIPNSLIDFYWNLFLANNAVEKDSDGIFRKTTKYSLFDLKTKKR